MTRERKCEQESHEENELMVNTIGKIMGLNECLGQEGLSDELPGRD